jgi:hypothetical protein
MSETKKEMSYVDSVCLDINSTGPHYEYIGDFNKSFFKSVYKRAFMQLDDIISHFDQSDKYGIVSSNKGYYVSESDSSVNSGYEGFPNIITFVGKRGSGKTSAMLSFMEALKHYYSYMKMTNGNFPYRLKKVEKPLFSCLDCIDGSLLEHGEDIFKVVLAQMYQKFIDLDKQDGITKEEDFSYRKRELLKQLEEIYRTVCDIENMEKRQSLMGESYMSSLQSLSSSQKVKKDFEELIFKFTALMKYERRGVLEKSSEHYMVITIDDIDLNVSNGFSMLEKIHRYCMVQNVIVLLSVDVVQMLSIVSKSFYKVLPKVDKLLCDGEKQVHELSMDYLNKVMPVNYRLYMPDLSNYHSSYGLSVKKEKASIKRSVFWKLYRRIGIYFDSQGVKQHFYEPKSMRQLTCFYLMLESMDRIVSHEVYYGAEMDDKKKEDFIRTWEENYRLLTDDLYYRIVLEKLYTDKDAVELREMIVKEDVRRARDEVVNFYYMRYKEKGGFLPDKKYCRFAVESTKENGLKHLYNCSYGQLVEAIYALGREESARYKTLAHYLLGYFSYAFTRAYIYEKLAIQSNGNILVKKGTFKSLIGENIVDDWSMLIMPSTSRERNVDVEEIAAASEDKSNRILEYFSNFKDVTLTQVFFATLKDEEVEDTLKYRYVAELIRNIELILLFFANIRESGQNGVINSDSFKWDFKIDFSKEGKERIMFMPLIEGASKISFVGDYSVLNFVGNSMYASKMLEEFEKGLIICLDKKYELYEDDSKSTLKEVFERELKLYSLKEQFENWEKEFGESSLPLPLYWFDFTYNILKRVKRAMNEEFIVSADTENIFYCIQKLYQFILTRLEEQQKFYFLNSEEKEERQKDGIDPCDYKLAERFEKCPVVAYFLEVKPGSADENKRKQFIHGMMSRLRRYSQK